MEPAPGVTVGTETRILMPRWHGAARSASRAWRVLGWLSLPLLLVLFLLALPTIAFQGHVAPSVWVGDVDVGGLTRAEARALIAARGTALAEQPVSFDHGDPKWTVLPADLGITYDTENSLAAALAFGRERDRVAGFLYFTRLARQPVLIPLAVHYDPARFETTVDRLDAEFSTPAVDAAIRVEGTDVSVVPSRDGWEVDRAAFRDELMARLEMLEKDSLTLPMVARPAEISTEQVAEVKEILDRSLSAPISLTLGGESWQLPPERLAGILRVTVTMTDGAASLVVDLDQQGLAPLIAEIAAEVDTVATEAAVEDLSGHQRLTASVRGRTLRRDDLTQAVRRAFAAGEHSLEIPVSVDDTPVAFTTDQLLADLGIADLVATGESDFSGSDAVRTQNVRLAVERIDGTLIPPGGVFSYNAAVGSLFTGGFSEADATIGGVRGTAIGGGVCQVSTTVFRAALEAGLPIVEWWPHTFRSPFYEQGGWSPGFDASIVQDSGDPDAGADFRFTNTTDSWLLLRAVIEDDTHLRIELHGAAPEHVVRFDEPVLEVIEFAPSEMVEVLDPDLPDGTVVEDQAAADGVQVTVVRRIIDRDGNEVGTDTFVSTYQAQAVVRRVGPSFAGDGVVGAAQTAAVSEET